MSSFEKALSETLGYEGGFSNNARDRGGATKFGIIERVARAAGYTGPMAEMPAEIAREIYRKQYWEPNRLDDIAAWHEPAALELFDTGVNQGVPTAAQYFQRACNLLNRNGALYPDIKVDGHLGAVSLACLKHLASDLDKRVFVKMLDGYQAKRYIEIMESDATQREFARGWFDKRIGNVKG